MWNHTASLESLVEMSATWLVVAMDCYIQGHTLMTCRCLGRALPSGFARRLPLSAVDAGCMPPAAPLAMGTQTSGCARHQRA